MPSKTLVEALLADVPTGSVLTLVGLPGLRPLPWWQTLTVFVRRWYNRAGVERVMGCCTQDEYEAFVEDAPRFAQRLVRSDTIVRKHYLDIIKGEQKRRLAKRHRDLLTQWKISPLDQVAARHRDAYTAGIDKATIDLLDAVRRKRNPNDCERAGTTSAAEAEAFHRVTVALRGGVVRGLRKAQPQLGRSAV